MAKASLFADPAIKAGMGRRMRRRGREGRRRYIQVRLVDWGGRRASPFEVPRLSCLPSLLSPQAATTPVRPKSSAPKRRISRKRSSMDRPVRQMSAGIQVVEWLLVAGLSAGSGKKGVINKGEGQWCWPRRVNLG